MPSRLFLAVIGLCVTAGSLRANPPVASYTFPAGGQRGTTVSVRVGGLFLHEACGFEMLGPGVKVPKQLKRMHTVWFEGPLLPLPASQQAEDYPKDMAGQIEIAKDAALGPRYWRLWTSQGATPALKFVVGELPETVEAEIDGDPLPVKVTLPVTVNGRIFPREDVDVWTFAAKRGETILCEVNAARLGSPLDARLDILDGQGRRIAENDNASAGTDPRVRFTARADGEYQVRIQDARFSGGQAFVYRLTLTAAPHVDHVYPLGGRRGTKVQARLFGQGVPQTPVELVLPADVAEYRTQYRDGAGRTTNEFLLELDDLPEHVEQFASSPRTLEDARAGVALPAVFNGRIDKPGDVDGWSFTARKGETYVFDLRAGRLGSPLDGVLRLTDASGKELTKAEATGPAQLDPAFNFTMPADGRYTIHVQDRYRARGGPAFAYRLRVAPPAPPDFALWLQGDAVTVPRDGQAKLKILADRLGGLKEPIALSVNGLPSGVTVTGNTLAAGQAAVDLTLKADTAAAIDVSRLKIEGTAKTAGGTVSRVAKLKAPRGTPELDSILLAVALPTPFVIKGEYDMGFAARGSLHTRKYKIERNGFDGPMHVSLTDRQARHLQGVTGPTIVVPAGVSEFTYSALLPPWMETGRTCRVCVMGVGVIKDADGREHRISFSSVNQNEQLVAVVGPGKLALELERTSVTLRPGAKLTLAVQIRRAQGLKGGVKLELIVPAHLRGIKADAAEIRADQDRGQLSIHADADMRGPVNMPVVVRATLVQNGQPAIAEAKLEVDPD